MKRDKKRRAEAIALLRLLEQKVEEAVGKPGLFNELINQETSENKISINSIPNDYSKQITAAGALQLPVDDTLTLTAGFTTTQGHQYQTTIEIYLTAIAVASAGYADVSILFYSPGQSSWSIKINSIYLSY